jgi:hypothetical protein
MTYLTPVNTSPRQASFDFVKTTTQPGYGAERYLYELNPSSEFSGLGSKRIVTPFDLLLALEDIACTADRPSCPIDHSLAAFLVSRWKGLKYSDLRDLRNCDETIQYRSQLRILSDIQEFYKAGNLPYLCQWMAHLCSPLFSKLHSNEAKDLFKAKTAWAVNHGQLNNLVSLFCNTQILNEDIENYRNVKTEVLLIQSEIIDLEKKIESEASSLFTKNKKNQVTPEKIPARFIVIPLIKTINFLKTIPLKIRIASLKGKQKKLYDGWGDMNMSAKN